MAGVTTLDSQVVEPGYEARSDSRAWVSSPHPHCYVTVPYSHLNVWIM